MLCPTSGEELAAALHEAASRHQTITIAGHNSKRLMAGPISPSDLTISTSRLNRILQYEPRDLTISLEPGLPWAELKRALASNGQMIPLDPPHEDEATIGGIVAANISGPRRRVYGAARDMVIGMKFATLQGKLVQSGGMVVKNVAGLDMAKMIIGSFGTLAAIAVVNFKVHPIPPATRTFVRDFNSLADAMTARDAVHKGLLQPAALDLVKENAKYRLIAQAGGNQAVIDRCTHELKGWEALDGDQEERLWNDIREFTPTFLRNNPNGAVVRVPCPLAEVGAVLEELPSPAIARAGSGVCYGYFEDWRHAVKQGVGVIEYAPAEARESMDLWSPAGGNFEIMKKVKGMFDPESLLNRRRLYGRI